MAIRKTLEVLKKIVKKLKLKKICDYLDILIWHFSKENLIMKKYYKNIIKGKDAIIFVGGGLIKYKYQNCYHYINEVTKIAEENQIPTFLNAVGVEGYDEKNVKCKILIKALNRDCVKMITTRDDIDNLKKYIRKEKNIEKVADSAVYANTVFNKEKDKKSNFIGLGICRGNIFLDNNINFNEKQALNLWLDIIKKLDKNNIQYKIYTNGLEADNEFARKVCENLDKEVELLIPDSPEKLVEIISSFKGVIATRLHSCIVAFSLDVPTIGLIWNEKLRMFGESIGYPERFLKKEEFNAEKIVQELLNSINLGYNNLEKEKYKESVKKSLEKFIITYI